MNKINKLVKDNKITEPIINKYKRLGSNIEMIPTELTSKDISLVYDEYNVVNDNRVILFNRRAKLCYIFKPSDYKIIMENIELPKEKSILTGQTKV